MYFEYDIDIFNRVALLDAISKNEKFQCNSVLKLQIEFNELE